MILLFFIILIIVISITIKEPTFMRSVESGAATRAPPCDQQMDNTQDILLLDSDHWNLGK